MKHFTIPSKASFAYLFHIIPQATHITSYPTQFLIELERCDDNKFAELLQTLPAYVGDFDIGYLNGVSWFDIHARRLSPDPPTMDGVFDDTNYLSEENGRSLRPGCLLECKGWKDENGKVHDSYVCNAGVLIERGRTTIYNSGACMESCRSKSSLSCWTVNWMGGGGDYWGGYCPGEIAF